MKEWVGIVSLKNNRLLMVRENGSELFTLPGGTVEQSETCGMALLREIKEELNVAISIKKVGTPWKEFIIKGKNENSEIKFILYRYEFDEELLKGEDIAEIIWVNPFKNNEPQRIYGAVTTEKLFPLLFWLGLLKS